jgi:hypothetical protein
MDYKKDYKEYIRSKAWKKVRERYWASKLPQCCYICGSERQPGFHLHHATYSSFGNEKLSHLRPVCQPCHTKIHQVKDKNPKWNMWGVTKYAHKQHLKEIRNQELTKKMNQAERDMIDTIVNNPYKAESTRKAELDKLFDKPKWLR